MPEKNEDPKPNQDSPWVPQGPIPSIVVMPPFSEIERVNRIKNRALLREWWHEVLRNHGRYACYAFFLFLPSDQESVQYMWKYAEELDQISNTNCLIIALSKREFRRSGFDKQGRDSLLSDSFLWGSGFKEQVSKGYSVSVAKLFGIKFNEFPCIVLFDDIRSTKRVVIPLKGLTTEQISQKMRLIFSLIQQAITDNKSPLVTLEQHQGVEHLRETSKGFLSKIFGFTEKTFETAIEAWIKATIK